MKTAIYGAGRSAPCSAHISQRRAWMSILSRNREHVDALNRDGAKIIGTVNMTVPGPRADSRRDDRKYELIILLTKQLDNVNVLKKLQKNMTDDCIVCTLQNGLPSSRSRGRRGGQDYGLHCRLGRNAPRQGAFRVYERARQHELRTSQNERSKEKAHAGEGAA